MAGNPPASSSASIPPRETNRWTRAIELPIPQALRPPKSLISPLDSEANAETGARGVRETSGHFRQSFLRESAQHLAIADKLSANGFLLVVPLAHFCFLLRFVVSIITS